MSIKKGEALSKGELINVKTKLQFSKVNCVIVKKGEIVEIKVIWFWWLQLLKAKLRLKLLLKIVLSKNNSALKNRCTYV